MDGLCDVRRCRQPAALCYYGAWLCETHWQELCADTASGEMHGSDWLRRMLPREGRGIVKMPRGPGDDLIRRKIG